MNFHDIFYDLRKPTNVESALSLVAGFYHSVWVRCHIHCISTILPVSRGVQRIKETISSYGIKFKAEILMGERERERARETDRQSDGDDSSYCVFIVSSMYNEVIFNT